MRAFRHQPTQVAIQPDSIDLEQIYAEYLDPVYRFLYARVGNREDAEDLTSQVFLTAFRRLDLARAERSIASWLFTVARTVLADHWREAYRYGPVAELNENLAERTDASTVAEDGVRVQQVNEILALLNARSRSVLELRFLRGYTVGETAQALGITAGNVKVIQHRALARAANLMDYRVSPSPRIASKHQSIA